MSNYIISPSASRDLNQIAKNVKINLVKLSEITTKIGSGATPKGGKQSYKNSGISLVRSLNIYDFKFEYQGLAFITETQAKALSNVEVKPNDILLNITGASVARCCMVPKHILPARVNQHVAIVRVSPLLANPCYVFYCINSSQYKSHLLALAQGGATREALTKDTISNFEIPLPPLPTQQKIASILTAYDDLIENNTRRIKILEEMARSHYHEWFVNFRFPGYEQVKMVDSELGLIPEGWIGKLEDALILQRGFDLPNKKRQQGNIPVYAATGTVGYHNIAKVKAPGIVTGRSGSLGTVIYIDEDFWALNTTLWVKEFRKVTPIYAFYLLSSLDLEQYNSGAAVPTLNRNDIHRLPVVIPSTEILEKFNHNIQPLFKLKKNLQIKNINLRKTRDLLLPKLISGEIDVEKLEIETEKIAA